jgi:signal transduction histidine kinase
MRKPALTKLNTNPKHEIAPGFTFNEIGPREHLVQFYETDSFLIHTVREYVQNADCVLLVVTKEHKKQLEKFKKDSWIILDADTTLSKFMKNDLPDRILFYEHIGKKIKNALKKTSNVRAFGEMVAVLFERGNHKAAHALEELWNELQTEVAFSLLCAYPMKSFKGSNFATPFSKVCTHHTRVLPAENYPRIETMDRRFRAIAILQQQAVSLESEMRQRIDLEKQKDRFLEVASEELCAPLNTLHTRAETLKKTFTMKNDAESLTQIERMTDEIDMLSSLARSMIDVTRIQAEKIEIDHYHFDIKELIEECVLDTAATTKSHTVTTHLDKPKIVHGDRDRIAQILTCLIKNAIHFSPEKDEVIIESHNKKGSVTISVTDFGIGLEKGDQEKIFDRFFIPQHFLIKPHRGLGLSLYISSEIAKKHGGALTVKSKKGRGSTFSLTLPL